MRMKKLLSLLLTVAMLCGMMSVLPMSANAADITLIDSYEKATGSWVFGLDTWNDNRKANYIVCYKSGFDAATDASWTPADYTGANRTATNAYGTEISINRYGFVEAIDTGENAVGNNAIPSGGVVISAHGTGEERIVAAINSGIIKIGTLLIPDVAGGSQYYAYNVTDYDKMMNESKTPFIPYTDLVEDGVKGSYATRVVLGGDGVTTDKSYWRNYLLCKQTGTTETGKPSGYAVKMINASTPIPEGYFVVKLPGQTAHDTGVLAYNAAMLLKDYAPAGTLVSCGDNELFFRYDAPAAVRAAKLLTGTAADMTYDFSASTILNDAKTNFELVDIDRMQALYDNMAAIAAAVETMSFAEMDAYMATLYQNYEELCRLEYEVRTVEMRATWLRPLPNDGVQRTAEELDAMVTADVLRIKDEGYNMIFVETFYNSTTIFPVPENVGYKDLYFKQNPYLVPASKGGLNNNLTETYDMLGRIIEICEENDMELHVWWEIFYVGYERTNGMTDSLFDYSVAKTIMNNQTKYEDWLNKASNGDLFYGAATDGALQYFLNPASFEARTFLLNTFKYVWENYDISSFQLDYIRYPHTNSKKCFGYDPTTMWLFKQSEYYDATKHTDAYLYSETGFKDPQWVQFRANFVTNFVKEIRDTMKSINPSIYLTASPGAEPEESKENLMQDVTYWLQNDYIDIIFPMAYGENVPGLVSAGLVKDNLHHFVCTGVSGTYLNDDMEARWMKEVRDAGADGLAAFGEIASYKDYVWSKPAVTPTGNAARAVLTYLDDTVAARAALMYKTGAISEADLDDINAVIADVKTAVTLYGVKCMDAALAIGELRAIADVLGANAQAALNKDIDYISKIVNNSLDAEAQKADKEELKANGVNLTVNGNAIVDGGEGFVYTAATDSLYITENDVVLGGELSADVNVVLGEAVDTVTLESMTLAADTLKANGTVKTVTLLGENTVAANVFGDDVTYLGTGALTCGDDVIMRKGDVDGTDELNTSDLRQMLRYCVNAISFTDDQIAVGDANGESGVTTIDVRMFLEAMLGK